MKNKVPVQTALERASQLAYSLENALRANKADYNYTLEMVVKIKKLVKQAEERVNLEHES
tara:strand:- start:398 stop:577 length:180 start_codon:yes stop_codon:yes gene_type:complete